MKITIYTITDCQFSKQEKEYLSAHGMTFEEKNLETNREYLTEMLAVGSNFAGTPVTKIEKDDGQIVVLKGFTVADFDKALGVAQAPSAVAPVVASAPVETPVPQVEDAPVVPSPEALPPVETVAPQVTIAAEPEVPPPAVTAPAVEAPNTDPAFASILSNLEQQAQAPDAPVVSPVPEAPQAPVAAPVAGPPVIPDPQF